MGKEQKYHGFSHPRFLGWLGVRWAWKKLLCPRGMHLWDEMLGTGMIGGEDYERPGWEHCLYCDACGAIVHIVGVDINDE